VENPVFKDIPCEIIDCHIHPPLTLEHDTSWFSPFESPEAFVETLKAVGISRACGTVVTRSQVESFDQVVAMNRSALAFRGMFPDFYIPGIHVDPRYPSESCRELEHYHNEEGVRWIGELVGYMMGYEEDYMPRQAFPIYELAGEMNVPVNFHCGELETIARMCRTFPKVAFVLAHPRASRNEFEKRLELVVRYPNLYLDLSGSGIMRWGMIRYGIDRAGKEKFLIGTDAPICNPAHHVACVLAESLSDTEREAVLGGNFRRLTEGSGVTNLEFDSAETP